METIKAKQKINSFKNDDSRPTEIKVESKFYDGTACDFTIKVKNVNNGMFRALQIMFSTFFAFEKIYPNKNCPQRSEEIIETLKPLALAVFRECCKQDIQDEEHGAELLELWTNQAFELLQSGHGGW